MAEEEREASRLAKNPAIRKPEKCHTNTVHQGCVSGTIFQCWGRRFLCK